MELQRLSNEINNTGKYAIQTSKEVEEKFNLQLNENLNTFAELKNNQNQISQSFTIINNDLDHYKQIFDRLSEELEAFKQQKNHLRKQIEYALPEVENKVSISVFGQTLTKMESAHLRDFDTLRAELSDFRCNSDLAISELRSYQAQMSEFQLQQNELLQKLQGDAQESTKELNNKIVFMQKSFGDFKLLLQSLEEQNRRSAKGKYAMQFLNNLELMDQQNQQLNSIQASTRKEFLKLTQDLSNFREKIINQSQEEILGITNQLREEIFKKVEESSRIIAAQVFDERQEKLKQLQQENQQDKEIQVSDDELEIVEEVHQINGGQAHSFKSEGIEIEKQTPTINKHYLLKKLRYSGREMKTGSSASKRNNTLNASQPNEEKIVEMIERSVNEQLNEVLTTSPVLYEQIGFLIEKQKLDVLEVVKKEINVVKINYNNLLQMIENKSKNKKKQKTKQILQNQQQNQNEQQNLFSQDQLSLLSVMEQLDDLKGEIIILLEMRQEYEQRTQQLSLENVKLEQKFEKFSNQMLKIKSDFFTENQFLNQQLKQLIKDKDSERVKVLALINLISSLQESVYIIFSILIQSHSTSYQPMKFSSLTEGIIYEISSNNDLKEETKTILYRNNKYQITDLLKKVFLGNIELWNGLHDQNLLPELTEHHPSKAFRSQILQFKQAIAVQSPMDLSKTIGEFPQKFCNQYFQSIFISETILSQVQEIRNEAIFEFNFSIIPLQLKRKENQ